MSGEHDGHRQRMRERFCKQGLVGFAPHETLELILFYAIPKRDVNPLSHRLMERFGSLHSVLQAPVEELMKVEGIGEYAATLLSLFACVARQLEHSRAGQKETLRTRAEAVMHCTRLLRGLRQEHFYVVCLNAQMQVIYDALVARGSLGEVQAYPRLVVETALRHNAHSVILCHNHPGGSVIPSQQDLETTQKLALVLQDVEIVLSDHIIVTEDDALSMVSCGLMEHRRLENEPIQRVADSSGLSRNGEKN